MRIAELYKSVQGEGRLTGTESIFLRVSGCNLRCGFCDTPYASWQPEGEELPLDTLRTRIEAWDCEHVVITGGEPMLFADLVPLSHQLAAAGHHLTVETAGTCYLPVACHLMSISPKLANSTPSADAGRWRERHEATRHAPEIQRRLCAEFDYQLKFVIDRRDDCEEVEEYLRELPAIDRTRVYLMPQGTDAPTLAATGSWLAEYCRERSYQFCPRRQIEWFGYGRGT